MSSSPVTSRSGDSPMQDRALDRISNILEASRDLIVQVGVDQVSMSDIAARANSKMAAMYRYFPNKAAILSTLYRQQAEDQNVKILNALDGVQSLEDFGERMLGLFEEYAQRLAKNPADLEVVQAIRAHSELRNLDVDNDFMLSYRIAAALAPLLNTPAAQDHLQRCVFLILTTLGPLTRAALAQEPTERAACLKSAKLLFTAQLRAIIDETG